MEKLLVIGDVQVVAEIESGLGGEFALLTAFGQAQAQELLLRHAPKAVILDMGSKSAAHEWEPGWQDRSGPFRCLQGLTERRPGTKVVVLTEAGQRETGYRALECGAYDFHNKPIDLAQLRIVIARAMHLSCIEEHRGQLQEALVRSTESLEGIADQCATMRKLFHAMQALEGPDPVSERHQGGGCAAGPSLKGGAHGGQGGPRGADPGPRQQERGIAVPAESLAALSTEQLTLREVRDRVEKGMLSAAVGNCGGNLVRASELLGVSRPALYDLLKKHGLFKPGARH